MRDKPGSEWIFLYVIDHVPIGTTSSFIVLWARPWGMALLLGLRGVPSLHSDPSEGMGVALLPFAFAKKFLNHR